MKRTETVRRQQGWDDASNKYGRLDLPFDVDFPKGCGFVSLKESCDFASKESQAVWLLLEKGLAIVVTYKLGSIAIRFETKLFGNESKFNIWLVTREC